MKLRFYMNSEGKKIYTLKEKINEQKTNNAHYKFLKIRDAPKSNGNSIRKD